MGLPTFFLTMTVNPYWSEYQTLKRGSGPFSDAPIISIVFRARRKCLMKYCRQSRLLGNVTAFVWQIESQQRGLLHPHILFWTGCDTSNCQGLERIVSTRFPDSSPLECQRQMVSDYQILIEQFQIHHHMRRCRKHGCQCKFGNPKPVNHTTTIQNLRYRFCQSEADQNINPHSLQLLSLFRCHHCLEVIHCKQSIGYVLKYCSKKSDVHPIATVVYEGAEISSNQPCNTMRLREYRRQWNASP
jgi:hypothetical protein